MTNAPIGVPSGWEEAASHCKGGWLELQLFHPDFNEPDQFYCDDAEFYDWRVEE